MEIVRLLVATTSEPCCNCRNGLQSGRGWRVATNAVAASNVSAAVAADAEWGLPGTEKLATSAPAKQAAMIIDAANSRAAIYIPYAIKPRPSPRLDQSMPLAPHSPAKPG